MFLIYKYSRRLTSIHDYIYFSSYEHMTKIWFLYIPCRVSTPSRVSTRSRVSTPSRGDTTGLARDPSEWWPHREIVVRCRVVAWHPWVYNIENYFNSNYINIYIIISIIYYYTDYIFYMALFLVDAVSDISEDAIDDADDLGFDFS